ncbi:cartilage intermediate layer protein 2 (predicted) [Rattus norvegicus]|uniref:Cartilage intermediate layer protein 2 n=2 Tax=Rattus norvegicus TaxID=10116 RepID=D3ZE05_RAT|nr:cartilage intermediate layer protein 2 precursor [Rattus norvegicus]EDL90630.1 cartilage intermediate layer protein 2 (predicted) [Rattus norvegicus]|eukprot:NP_001100777.1 cartilage intermediate layer protein 2 precursor [Rattus norvegicus]
MSSPLPLLYLCIAAAHLAGARDATPTEEHTATVRGLQGRPPDPGQPSPALEDWEEASEWTSWFNVDHPGGDGDFESLAAIRFYYGPARVCPRPLALEARTTDWALPAAIGERVHANPERGFWCLNREQPRGRRCSNYHVRFRCPLDPPYLPPCSAEAAWGAWGAWGLCSKSCGPGRRLRRRSCQSSSGDTCPGSPQEAQKCVRSRCPAPPKSSLCPCCSHVPLGCSSDTCGCPNHILLGSVVTPSGRPLSGARVSLRTRPGTVATSDTHGTFRVPGVCAGSKANVSARMNGFSTGTAQAHANTSNSAVVTIVLEELGKPYLVKHPESRVREAGQNVTFCCKASGTPMPKKYSWFHNGTLLDRRQQGSGPHLELQGLREEQAGEYHCKAWNEAGTVRSRAAHLTVLAPGQPACDPRPQEHLIKLPDDCGQPGGGPTYLDVGLCADTRCPGPVGSGPRCGDAGSRCCSVLRLESRDIRCSGYVLPVKVVAECGCRKCLPRRGLVRGRVVAADSGEPLRFARILLGLAPIGFTSYQGDFTIEVPPATERLVVTFVDSSGEFVDSIRVLPFDPRGAGVYHEIRVLRKAAAVLLDAEQGGEIPLGGTEEAPALGELVFPPRTFHHPDGRPYSGPVEARVTFVDPRDLASAAAASSDLRYLDSSGELAPLRTYGMFAVDLHAPGSTEQLHVARADVRVDADHVRMPGHADALALWSLDPETGLWEEEGAEQGGGGFRREKEAVRVRREERTFLVGALTVRERRLFNLDVPERRRCFVKVRAYGTDRFAPSEQVQGVVVTLLNLEPAPGFTANPRAWGRFDSAVTGPNGACVPAFCDAERPDAYTAFVTASLGGEELEAAPSRPRATAATVGVAEPYLERLGYQRTDHDDPALKRTGFRLNLARPRTGHESEAHGPVYPWRRLRDCEDAPVTDSHFRFSRVEADKYEYDVVPFHEGAPASWTGDLLAWWPNPQEFRACFLKVRLQGPQEYMVRSHNAGGTHEDTRGHLYGLRDTRSVRNPERPGASAACVEFKCGGMLFDQRQVDRTLVTVTPQGSCRRVAVNTLLQDYLARHPPLAPADDPATFAMLAPLDALGHNYGVYTVTDQSPRLAKEIAIGRCFDGSSDGFSREMKADAGTAVTFQCREPPARPSLFQRLLENPASALGDIRREMGQAARDSRVTQTQAGDTGPFGSGQ